MVVAVDEVASPPGAAPAGRLRRVLRRGLLIAALAAAGWLCGALFSTAAAASASPAPPTEQQPRGLAGYLGSVTNAVTNTVTHTVRQAVHQVDRTAVALTHAAAPATPEPAGRPVAASPAPVQPSGAERAAIAPAPTPPPEPPATPALPVTVAPAAEHPPRAPVDPTSQRTSAAGVPDGIHSAVRADQQAEEDARATRHSPGQPDRSPATPVAPSGTSGYTAHDTGVGGRGVLGVLTDSAPRPPPAVGHATRGSAANATGRVAGLPATAPD
jgi:hypothetical protein